MEDRFDVVPAGRTVRDAYGFIMEPGVEVETSTEGRMFKRASLKRDKSGKGLQLPKGLLTWGGGNRTNRREGGGGGAVPTTRQARRARWLRFPPVSAGEGGRLEFDTLVEGGRRKYQHKNASGRGGGHNRTSSTGSNGGNGGNGGSPVSLHGALQSAGVHDYSAGSHVRGRSAGDGGGGASSPSSSSSPASSSPSPSPLQQAFRDPMMYQRWNRKQLDLRKNQRNSRSMGTFASTLSGLRSITTGLKKRAARRLGPLAKWDEYFTTLVRKGVPEDLRGQVWRTCSGSDEMWADARNAGYMFNQIVDRATQQPPPDMDVIERDLTRTFPDNSNFDNDEGIQKLRCVLMAYSVRNPGVGYCQSMNFLVAVFLLHMNEEEAFWTLCAVVEVLTPEYYSKNMRGIHVDGRVFRTLIAEALPKIHTKLEENYVELAPIVFQWFLCLFVNTLPLATTLRVWDAFFHEGTKILFRIGIALLKLNEKTILQAEGPMEVLRAIQDAPKLVKGSSLLMKTAFDNQLNKTMTTSHIDELRQYHVMAVDIELRETEELREEMRRDREEDAYKEEVKAAEAAIIAQQKADGEEEEEAGRATGAAVEAAAGAAVGQEEKEGDATGSILIIPVIPLTVTGAEDAGEGASLPPPLPVRPSFRSGRNANETSNEGAAEGRTSGKQSGQSGQSGQKRFERLAVMRRGSAVAGTAGAAGIGGAPPPLPPPLHPPPSNYVVNPLEIAAAQLAEAAEQTASRQAHSASEGSLGGPIVHDSPLSDRRGSGRGGLGPQELPPSLDGDDDGDVDGWGTDDDDDDGGNESNDDAAQRGRERREITSTDAAIAYEVRETVYEYITPFSVAKLFLFPTEIDNYVT